MNNTTAQTKNSNLIVSLYGSEIAVGIEGTREQIEQQFNRFFNLGAAASGCTSKFCSEDSNVGDNYLHFLSDTFAYFLSSEKAMVKALETEQFVNMNNGADNSKFAGKKFGAMEVVKAQAIEDFKNIKRENFMLYKSSEVVATKQLDGGAPSWDMSDVSLAETMLM